MPDLSTRSSQPEVMDDPCVPPEDMCRALAELETINRRLGGHATSLAGVARLLPAGTKRLSLLDVGTGGGDFPRALVTWATRRGITASVRGIDLAGAAVEFARDRSRGFEAIAFSQEDLFDIQAERSFDVVHAALLLHHFEDGRASEALRKMHALGEWGVVINDLHRHPFAYHSIRILTSLFSRSRLIRSDAPISVARAFSRTELVGLAATAGLPCPKIRWRWAFRWQVVIPR